MFVDTKAWQKYFVFVATNIILLRQNICHDKHTFVTTKDVFGHDKHVFVTRKVCLSQQNYICKKVLLWHTCFCCDKHVFVKTNIILLREAYICRDKRYVLLRQTHVKRADRGRICTIGCSVKIFDTNKWHFQYHFFHSWRKEKRNTRAHKQSRESLLLLMQHMANEGLFLETFFFFFNAYC